ncbi:MAG TPA: hypothetical protein VK028_15395 [Micromonosporaceae bacterium]|nr:hypothetical protein [Micromonosporaceae bacterium]
MATTAVRRTARMLLLIASMLGVAVLVGGIARQSWAVNSRTAEVVRLEQYGAKMLHPMTTLLGELVQAQSNAVRGEQVDAETLRQALASVHKIDQGYGEALQTRQRLASLTAAIESAVARNETGRAAFDTYSSLVTLTVDLMRRIADTSHLIHDPDLDSYYLMEAAIVLLPDAIVLSGRAADLVALAGGRALEGEDAIRAAVARFGVSSAAEKVSQGLNKSVEVTARSALGVNIAERLDAFRAAADAFAPPTMLVELANPVDAATLAENATRVGTTANPLAHRLLSELEALLAERASTLESERQFTLAAAIGVALFAIVMAWIVLTDRGRRAGRHPAPATSGHDLPVGSLAYARDLLESDLVGVRGGDRASHRGGLPLQREAGQSGLVSGGPVVADRGRHDAR